MGFSSYLCRQCGNPALCPSATINSNSWMSDVVLVPKEGATIEGTYDGYGGVVVDDRGTVERLPVRDCYGFTEGTLLHKACAEKRGAHYRGPSPNADCQRLGAARRADVGEHSHQSAYHAAYVPQRSQSSDHARG